MKYNSKLLTPLIVYLFLVGILTLSTSAQSQGKWSVFTSFQLTRGTYNLENTTNTYAFYGGLRYKSSQWSIVASLPVIGQNNTSLTNTGGVFFPTRHHGNGGGTETPHHGGGMSEVSLEDQFVMGMGDIYVNGEYQVLNEGENVPYIGATARLKLPTANKAHNFGTGETDYGLGLTFRKRFEMYWVVMDLGFWKIGDPDSLNLQDVKTLGIGVGRFFQGNRLGIMLYFENYSRFIKELEPVRQLTFAINSRISTNTFFLVTGGKGITNTSPDFTLGVGLELIL
ncbi:MAG: hypothetical protein D6748_06985 [Calditrichaeota bacterium]|nr:MAG: hypothetical protein D6748_06985 [Calditrichota bacterium]